MFESFDDDQPLYPDDITSESSPEAVHADIHEIEAIIEEDALAGRLAQKGLIQGQHYLREVSFGVLRRLSTLGVEEAELIAGDLSALNPDVTPLTASLSEVALAYHERAMAAEDEEEQTTLLQRETLTMAIFAITTAQAVRWKLPSDVPLARELVSYAHDYVRDASDLLPEATSIALRTQVNELASTLPRPPKES